MTLILRQHEADALSRYPAIITGLVVTAHRDVLHEFVRHRRLCVYLAHRQYRTVSDRCKAEARAWRQLTPHLRPGVDVSCPMMTGGVEPVLLVDGEIVVRMGEAKAPRAYAGAPGVESGMGVWARVTRAQRARGIYTYRSRG